MINLVRDWLRYRKALAEIRRNAKIRRAVIGRLRSMAHKCSACGNVGRCEVSEHYLFCQDRVALRCKRCRHVWAINAELERVA
jgi:primosomal protein N'